MIEHIFRNINDIRVFDAMVDFVSDDEEEKEEEKRDDHKISDITKMQIIDVDEIMDILEYGEYKRIEIEDSLDHLVRQKILGIKKIKVEGKTGCKMCKHTDKLKLPRIGDHKSHVPEETSMGYVNNYYMKINDITNGLRSAAFAHIFLVQDDIDECRIDDNK